MTTDSRSRRSAARATALLAAATAALAGAGLAATVVPASAGVSGLAFYVDGVRYRTVATPTDLSGTGAPASSFDVIYGFGGAQPNVAEAAPGDVGFNGGRWAVHPLSFPNGYSAALASGDLDDDGVIDSDEEVHAAIAAGDAVDGGAVRWFVCTVNKAPANG